MTGTRGEKWTIVGSAVVVSAIIAVLVSLAFASQGAQASASTQDVWTQVVERGTLRAAYLSNPPSCIIDPATGDVSGIAAEIFERIAENLGVRVEWTEEVGFGSMIEGLRAGRYDVVPCSIWPTGARARHATFSRPLFFSAVGAYVRSDDHRFDDDLSAVNDPSVTIATMDGEMAQAIAAESFPRAQTISVPQTSEITSMLLNVRSAKADVTFVELYFAHEFLKNNPGTLRNVTVDAPVRIFPNTFLLPAGAPELRDKIDISLTELINLGVVEAMISRYEPAPGIFHRVASPIVLPDRSSQ